MLSGCDDSNEQARFGPPTEVAAFQTVQQCVDSGQYDRATCTAAQQKAFNEDGKVAPRFDSQQLCEEQFGAAQCQRRSEGGQSFFTPLLTGFLIGQILNNNTSRYTYGGLYRDRRNGGGWYTPGARISAPATAIATMSAARRSPRRSRPSASRRAARSSRAAASAAG